MTVVWNQHGDLARQRILAAVPDAVVVDVALSPEQPPAPPADVLFAAGRFAEPAAAWARDLPWIHVGSSGVETLPADLLTAGILTCSRGLRSPAIAEFVVAALLTVVKDMPAIWAPDATASDFNLRSLAGSTVGVIGLGTIGQEIATRLAPFGVRLVGTRRTATSGSVHGVEVMALDEMLPLVDHLVIAAPATAESARMLDAAAFALLKPGAHLVNVSRGSLVDNDALLAALDRGQVALASLDVTEPEPLPAEHPLRQHPRVRLSPHVCFMDGDSTRVIDLFVANLVRYEAGEPLLGVVDVDAGY